MVEVTALSSEKIVLTNADKLELDKLDKWGEFLNELVEISSYGVSLSRVLLVGVLVYTMYFETIPLMSKIVSSILLYYFPWLAWIINFMGISISFTVTKWLLISSGLVIGALYIRAVIECFIDRANYKVDEILSKYQKEEDNNE